MDPWAPINGISLERYAELSAEVSETQDAEKQAEIITKLGVQRADWDAAKAGWTARMQDMSLMGQVATRFMPMYNAALAKKTGGPPQVSFEDYVAMSGAVPVIGYEGMLQHYKITPNQWTMIAGAWNNQIPTNPQYMQYGALVVAESNRIRAGGQPKPVTIGAPAGAGGGGAPSTPGGIAATTPAAGMGGMAAGMGAGFGPPPQVAGPPPVPAYGMPPPNAMAPQPQMNPQMGMNPQMNPQMGGMNPNPYMQQQQGYPQQNPYYAQQQYAAQNAGAQMGNALNAFGSAFGSFVEGAVGAFAVGSRVMVQWSDGNRYPGTVTASQTGQVQVAFPDGRQVWVPQGYVSI